MKLCNAVLWEYSSLGETLFKNVKGRGDCFDQIWYLSIAVCMAALPLVPTLVDGNKLNFKQLSLAEHSLELTVWSSFFPRSCS